MAVRVNTDRQTHTEKDGFDSIISTADAGVNNNPTDSIFYGRRVLPSDDIVPDEKNRQQFPD